MSTQIISRTRIGNYAVVAIIMCLLALIVAVVLIALQKEALAIQQAQISFCAKSFPTDRQGVTILQYGDSVAICGQAGSALRETRAQVLAVWETQKGDFVDMAPFEWSGNEPESEGMIAFSAVPC